MHGSRRTLVLLAILALALPACRPDVTGPNRPPVARAGMDQIHDLDDAEPVVFDGGGSYDPDADPLTFAWRVLSRPAGEDAAVTLQDADTQQPWLAPSVPGTWILSLRVSDGDLVSEPDTLRLLVRGRACGADGDCADDLWCNGAETCQQGLCAAGPPPDCDDSDACTLDACDELADECSHAVVPNPGAEGPEGDSTCADGVDNDCDGLTDLDDLDCGQCQLDAQCDDGNPCTLDTCDPQGACQRQPATAGTDCDDGLFCDGDADRCDGAGACGPPSADLTPCMDPCLAACNEQEDFCGPSTAGTDCSAPGDGIDCTLDFCDGLGACVSTADDGACGDGEFCLPDCAIDASGCVPTPNDLTIDCQPGNPAACSFSVPGLANQADCIQCTTEIAPTVLGDTGFSNRDGSACDLDGWELVTGDNCSPGITNCAPDEFGNRATCCDDPDSLCVGSNGDWHLRTDYRFNCGDSVRHEWRLRKTFDATGLRDLSVCFDLAEHNATSDEWLLLYVSDPAHPWPGERVRCQSNGPGVDDNDTWYTICAPLDRADNWERDNPALTVTFIAYSSNDNESLSLDNVLVRGFPLTSQQALIKPFSDRFETCSGQLAADYNGWTVTGQIDCPGFSECSASIPNYQGTVIQVEHHDAQLERRLDVSPLDDQIEVCMWYGDSAADNNEGLVLEFEPWAGAGWTTAWIDRVDMGATACRLRCAELSRIDPRVNNSPDLGLRISLDSDSTNRMVALASVEVLGSQFEAGAFTFGAFNGSVDGQVDFELTNPSTDPLTARVRCAWNPAAADASAWTDVLVDPAN